MSIGPQGQNLIFLISQPRAGSTMLQRILGGHPDIHTVSEPWLMLHPFYALRAEGYITEYNEQPARVAVEGFLRLLPGGRDDYVESLRRAYTYLYQQALAQSGKLYFLDKTPRYYFVIDELYETFPEAHYIILLRNPLAVLCSTLNKWIKKDSKERWFRLYERRHDLIRAPGLLLGGIGLLGKRCIVIHYEDFVKDPGGRLQQICEILGIPFTLEIIEYGLQDLPLWRHGDQGYVYQHTRPVSLAADKWIQQLEDPQVWRLAHDYLQLLGVETVEQMGYAYRELRQVLQAHRPSRNDLRLTFPLANLFKKPVKERRKWEWYVLRLSRSLQQRGRRETVGRR